MNLQPLTRLTTVDKGGDYSYVGRHTNINSIAGTLRKLSSKTRALGAGPDRGMTVTLLDSDQGNAFQLENQLPEGKSYYAQIEVYMERPSGQLYFRSIENFAERMRVVPQDAPVERHVFDFKSPNTAPLPGIVPGKRPFEDNGYLTLLEEQVQQERRARFSLTCMAHSLGWLLREAEDCPNVDNFYHNAEHMLDVAIRAVELYQAEVMFHATVGDTVDLITQHRDISTLIIAGLLHDWGHSGGSRPDKQNIADAVAKVQSLKTRIERNTGYSNIVDMACAAIEVTEFPFVLEPNTLVEKCLRDADVMGFFEAHGSKELFERFWPEAYLAGKVTAESAAELLGRQRAFIQDLTFYTEAGQAMANRQRERAMARAQLYVEESLRINSL